MNWVHPGDDSRNDIKGEDEGESADRSAQSYRQCADDKVTHTYPSVCRAASHDGVQNETVLVHQRMQNQALQASPWNALSRSGF